MTIGRAKRDAQNSAYRRIKNCQKPTPKGSVFGLRPGLVIFSDFVAFFELLELGNQIKAIAIGFIPGGFKLAALVPRANRLRVHPQKNRRLFYRQIFFPLVLH